MKLLIGALSGWQYSDRRKLCRDTWAKDLKAMGHDVVFLMGVAHVSQPIRDEGSDMLILPTPDTYPTLPQRTHWFAKWATTQQFDWAYKCDDDTMISPSRFVAFAKLVTEDYTGCEKCSQMPYHSGGAGYFLSQKAVKIIAEEMTEKVGAEDMIVGTHMNRHGIPTSYVKGYEEGFWFQERRPLPSNNYIVGHGKYMTRENWMESYEKTK